MVVRVGDLAVVEVDGAGGHGRVDPAPGRTRRDGCPRAPPGIEGRGRIVGRVGVDEVDEQEEGAHSLAVEPADHPVHGVAGPPLEVVAIALPGLHDVVVVIEALGEPREVVDEDEARDESRRLVTGPPEDLGEAPVGVVEPRVQGADAVPRREQAREQAREGLRGGPGGRVRTVEAHAAGGQVGHVRSGAPRVAVDVEVIGPQRVDRDPHHGAGATPGSGGTESSPPSRERRGGRGSVLDEPGRIPPHAPRALRVPAPPAARPTGSPTSQAERSRARAEIRPAPRPSPASGGLDLDGDAVEGGVAGESVEGLGVRQDVHVDARVRGGHGEARAIRVVPPPVG